MRRIVFVLGALGACNGGEIREVAQQPLAAEELVAVFPPDGALWLTGEVPIAVVLGADAAGEAPEVTITREDRTTTAAECVVEGTMAACGVVAVEGGEEIALDVRLGASRASVRSVGRQPAQGLAWSMLDGVEFTALGSGGSAVTLANGFLGLGTALLALDGYDGTPGAWSMYGGQSLVDGELYRLATPGLVFRLDAEVDEGGLLTASAPLAWCPVYLENGANHLLLLDVTLEGRIEGTALVDVAITADVPAFTLEQLSGPLGLFGGVLLDSVNLDVDRDGDGTFDAASVRLEGTPAPAMLARWAEG